MMLPITMNGEKNSQPPMKAIHPLMPAWLARAIRALVPVRKYLKKNTRTTRADKPTTVKSA